MTWSEATLLAAVLLLLLLWAVWVVASRLDRLHRISRRRWGGRTATFMPSTWHS